MSGDGTTPRLARQLAFLVELDKLKTVLRRTSLIDRSRAENTAEHSWHIAVAAALLEEHAVGHGVDLLRVVKMLLNHDVVEIDAGDTFCYDAEANRDKLEREERAAERLFGLLPADQGAELRALWEEFEARETAEARYAAALDRIQPVLQNLHTEGHSKTTRPACTGAGPRQPGAPTASAAPRSSIATARSATPRRRSGSTCWPGSTRRSSAGIWSRDGPSRSRGIR